MRKTKHDKENQCQGKQVYNTHNEASAAYQHLQTRSRKMRAYKCSNCGKYHFGHESHRRMVHHTEPDHIVDISGYTPGIHKGNFRIN